MPANFESCSYKLFIRKYFRNIRYEGHIIDSEPKDYDSIILFVSEAFLVYFVIKTKIFLTLKVK